MEQRFFGLSVFFLQLFFIAFRAVINLPEALGTHFSLKTAVLKDFVSVGVSSGLIVLWKCRKVHRKYVAN